MAVAVKNWEAHDFGVKMLDWSAARGSRLAYTGRRCGRKFSSAWRASPVWARQSTTPTHVLMQSRTGLIEGVRIRQLFQ